MLPTSWQGASPPLFSLSHWCVKRKISVLTHPKSIFPLELSLKITAGIVGANPNKRQGKDLLLIALIPSL